jgi:hypothetical protein
MTLENTTAPAAERSGFGHGEHLLVWTWRRIGVGRSNCPLILREFSHACGEDAAEVLATFCTFLQALAYASRRRLQIGHPGCLALTGDERQLLTLVAAAQVDHSAHFEAHLRWLARAELRPALAIAVRALATALTAHDLPLPLPLSVGPMMCERDDVDDPIPCRR